MGKINTSIEDSLKVLLSLFVMIDQNCEALRYYDDYISDDSEKRPIELPDKKENYIDEAIYESLSFQIIIKTCSFFEEWDKILGVLTEKSLETKVEIIKKIVKPAKKAVGNWKDFKKFRNEIIAHNFRDKNRNLKLDYFESYDIPQTIDDLSYINELLRRMINILTINLPIETESVMNSMGKLLLKKQNNRNDKNIDYITSLNEIDRYISDNTWAIPRYDIINECVKSFKAFQG